MTEINQPFSYKVSRYFLISEVQSENIGDLCGKDSYGDTACKTYDNGIGNEFDDCPQFEYTQ